jgi:hypothetical protein
MAHGLAQTRDEIGTRSVRYDGVTFAPARKLRSRKRASLHDPDDSTPETQFRMAAASIGPRPLPHGAVLPRSCRIAPASRLTIGLMPREASAVFRPAMVIGAFYIAVVVALLATHGWDPLFFATLGPQWERHDPGLQRQADGTVYFHFATDPAGAADTYTRLRAARILYPLVARLLALGRAELVGWALLVINVVAIVGGTEILHRLLARRGLPPWGALAYGAWLGLGLALLHDTPEPLAYLSVLAGIAASERNRQGLAAVAFLAALLTRETVLALVLPYLLAPGAGSIAARLRLTLTVLGAWGVWIGIVFLVASGPWVPASLLLNPPLSGYRMTRLFDLPVTVLFLVVPALLALGGAAWTLVRRPAEASLWAVVLNALLVLWLPPKTAEMLWHSGRLSTGLIAAVLLAGPLAASAPHLWRGLALVFAGSAAWTLAVTLRYLLWDVIPW